MIDTTLVARADALLSRMTLDEKIGQMHQIASVSERNIDVIRRGGARLELPRDDGLGWHRVKPAPRLFSDDDAENRASLRSLAALLAPQRTDVKALAFAHSGSLRGLDPLLAFPSR